MNTLKTVREYLDFYGIDRGSDYAINIMYGCCEMCVSRRYLEGGWKEVLDRLVVDVTIGDHFVHFGLLEK